MEKIDINNLKKYVETPSDNNMARIGHVNHALKKIEKINNSKNSNEGFIQVAVLSGLGSSAVIINDSEIINANGEKIIPTFTKNDVGDYTLSFGSNLAPNTNIVVVSAVASEGIINASFLHSMLVGEEEDAFIQITDGRETPGDLGIFSLSYKQVSLESQQGPQQILSLG